MKTAILTLMVLLLGVLAEAQVKDSLKALGSADLIYSDSTTVQMSKGRFMFNKFQDNWFFFAGAGGQVYFGDEDGLKPLGDRLTPTYEVGFGKWLHPVIGFRAKVGGGPIKGYSTGTLTSIGRSLIVSGPDADGIYYQHWRHIYIEGQLLIDMSNALAHYKRDRFYSAIIALGAGTDLALNQPKHNGDRSAVVSIALDNRFRLSKYLDFNIELKNSIVNQNFDREQSLKYYEFYLAATAGLTFRFGEAWDREFKKASDSRTTVNRYYRPKVMQPVEPPKPAEPIATPVNSVASNTKTLTNPIAVFFELDKAVVLDRDKLNIGFAADIIKNSNGEKFRLIGSADSHTATPPYNQKLSTKRCEAVKKILVDKYGIDPNQLILEPIGGINEYSPYWVNRAVVIKQQGIE